MVFLSTGSKWGPICHGLMMKFLARTQPTPPSTSHSFPEALYRSLFIILRNSPWRRLSHPLLGLCEREAEPGFRNFQWKPVAGLSQGAISGWTSCSSWPESGQFGQGDVSQWKDPGKSSLIRVTCISSAQRRTFQKHWVSKCKWPKSFQNSVLFYSNPRSGEQSLFIF